MSQRSHYVGEDRARGHAVKAVTKTALTFDLDTKADTKADANKNVFKGTVTADLCGPE